MAVYRIPTESNYHKNGSLVFKKPRKPKDKFIVTRYRVVMACLLAFFAVLVVVKLTANDTGPDGVRGGLAVNEPTLGAGAETMKLVLEPEAPTVNSEISALFTSNSKEAIFQWYRNGVKLEGETSLTLGAQELRKGDEITFTAYTEDLEESVSVILGNSPPSIKSVRLNPGTIHRGVNITAEALGSDADDDYLDFTYRWVINGDDNTLNTDSILPGDFFHRGDMVSVIVTPSDNEETGKDFVSVPVVIPNAPPRIMSTPPSTYEAGRFSYRISAVDPDGDRVHFSLGKAPDGMTINSGGLISWSFGDMETSEHDVEVMAIDSEGLSSSQSFSLSIEGTRDEAY